MEVSMIWAFLSRFSWAGCVKMKSLFLLSFKSAFETNFSQLAAFNLQFEHKLFLKAVEQYKEQYQCIKYKLELLRSAQNVTVSVKQELVQLNNAVYSILSHIDFILLVASITDSNFFHLNKLLSAFEDCVTNLDDINRKVNLLLWVGLLSILVTLTATKRSWWVKFQICDSCFCASALSVTRLFPISRLISKHVTLFINGVKLKMILRIVYTTAYYAVQ